MKQQLHWMKHRLRDMKQKSVDFHEALTSFVWSIPQAEHEAKRTLTSPCGEATLHSRRLLHFSCTAKVRFIFYLSFRQIKKPPPIWKRKKHLYHPFTYPTICAQDYGRAPTLITYRQRNTRSFVFTSATRKWCSRQERKIPSLSATVDPGSNPPRLTVCTYSVSGSHLPRLSAPFPYGYCLRHSL